MKCWSSWCSETPWSCILNLVKCLKLLCLLQTRLIALTLSAFHGTWRCCLLLPGKWSGEGMKPGTRLQDDAIFLCFYGAWWYMCCELKAPRDLAVMHHDWNLCWTIIIASRVPLIQTEKKPLLTTLSHSSNGGKFSTMCHSQQPQMGWKCSLYLPHPAPLVFCICEMQRMSASSLMRFNEKAKMNANDFHFTHSKRIRISLRLALNI